MNKSEPQSKISSEIIKTFDFFENSAKWIALGIMLGLIFSMIYLMGTKSKYEANVLINLATLDNNKPLINSNYFVLKLLEPSSYGTNVLKYCSLDLTFDTFIKNLKITPSLSNEFQIDLRYMSTQPKESVACLEVAIKVIKNIQTQELKLILENKEKKLTDLLDKISAIKSTLHSDNDSKIVALVDYMIVRDEINIYRSRILDLKKNIEAIHKTQAIVTSPVIQEVVIKPKSKIVLLNGIFSGIVLGLLIQLYRVTRHNLRKK